MEWANEAYKYSTYDAIHKKSVTQNQKFFCTADSKTCGVFWGFEQLTSTIGGGVIPAQWHL